MGPLQGLRVVELAGIGPAPFAGMVLADLGADMVRVDRVDGDRPLAPHVVLDRGRRSVALDLKDPRAVEVVLRMVERSDVLIEGYRPGVAERLGMGPAGQWRPERGTNLLDSGAPFYDVYACAGGRYVAVGALEDRFYAALLSGLGLDPASLPDRLDPGSWPALRRAFAERFVTR